LRRFQMASPAALTTSNSEAARPTHKPDGYKTVTVNGADLAYVERGAGEAVIFVHGGICDLRIWDKQMAPFSKNHRVVAYSRRYAWPNSEVPDGVDDQMEPHVDDLAALISKLGAAPAHLVGNSWGAFICLLTALRHPELVRSITVEEAPVLPLLIGTDPKTQDVLRLFLSRPRSAAAVMKFFATAMGPAIKAFKTGDLEGGVRIFAKGVLGPEVYESLPAWIKEAMLANGKPLSSELLGAGFPAFAEEDVRRIKTPTLLVTGEKSPAMLRRLTDRLQQLLPNVQRADIAGASHLMHYEQPASLNSAVLAFIAAH
jgi:pimeloyl-ACP methyl ester carboxylesterase